MNTLLRWIARLSALLSLFVAVLVAANWQDDPLTPEAVRLLAPPAPTSDAPNAYYVWLGIDAPDDEDALTAGRRIRDDFYQQLRENPACTDCNEPPKSKTISESVSKQEEFSCSQQSIGCVDFCLSEKTRIQQFMAEQTLLRQRYLQFSQIPVFDEPPSQSFIEPAPRYFALSPAAEIRLMEAVFAIDDGDLQTGANILMQEIRAHRRLLAGSSRLFTKMIGAVLLRRDYEMLSDAIEHWPLLAQQEALAEAWQPLSEQEYGMRRAIESEAAAQANTAYSLLRHASSGEFVKSSLYLPNATANVIARWASEDLENIEGDAATADTRYRAHIAKRTKEMDQMTPHISWRLIRNPIGKTLAGVLSRVPNTLLNFAESFHGLDDYIRLVTLQAALRRDDVPLAQVADYVQSVGPDLRNPYDGQPMRWDAATSTLSFEGRKSSRHNPEDTPKVFSVRLRFGETGRN